MAHPYWNRCFHELSRSVRVPLDLTRGQQGVDLLNHRGGHIKIPSECLLAVFKYEINSVLIFYRSCRNTLYFRIWRVTRARLFLLNLRVVRSSSYLRPYQRKSPYMHNGQRWRAFLTRNVNLNTAVLNAIVDSVKETKHVLNSESSLTRSL